ncbi:hypothetical protein FOMPIDRAFT_161431 [Fomitopsis schrenkii]|uniref:Uncharacterized protein n=1 Tax=Fomitopsis schrenkii TaxID=2126942 RepID=S8DZY7_FOMSC|nr:hypothetical protein FOMPIDRAFT_161431 [Fomitopsis schrenkii]
MPAMGVPQHAMRRRIQLPAATILVPARAARHQSRLRCHGRRPLEVHAMQAFPPRAWCTLGKMLLPDDMYISCH